MTVPEALTIPAGRVDERLAEALDQYRADWGEFDSLFNLSLIHI